MHHRSRIVPAVLATIAAAGCGGSEADTSRATSSPTPTTTTIEIPGDATPTPTTIADELRVPPSAPTTVPTVEQQIPGGVDEMFAAMFTELVAAGQLDDLYGAEMFQQLGAGAGSTAPDLVIAAAIDGSRGHGRLIEIALRHLTAGYDAGFGADLGGFFDTRLPYLAYEAETDRLLREMTEHAATRPFAERSCIASALLAGEECDDTDVEPELAAQLAALMAHLDDGFDGDRPNEPEGDLPPSVDLCAIWAAVDATPDELERFDRFIGGSTLDAAYLSRSECRYQAGLDEDAAWPPADQAVLDTYYRTIAGAALATGFDEDFYDNAGDSYTEGETNAIIIIGSALDEAAAQVTDLLLEPGVRAGVLGAAEAGRRQVALAEAIAAAGYDARALREQLASCYDDGPRDSNGSCDPAFEELGWYQTFFDEPVVDWGDVIDLHPICETWAAVLGSYGTDEALAIDFALRQLDVDQAIGVDECD